MESLDNTVGVAQQVERDPPKVETEVQFLAPAKECSKCGQIKALEEFHRNRKCTGGRTTVCVACSAGYARRYREENLEQLKLKSKFTRDKNKARKREYDRAYRAANIDKIKETRNHYKPRAKEVAQEWYKKNADHSRAVSKTWKTLNQDKTREYTRRLLRSDPVFKMCTTVRNVVRSAIRNRGFRKNTKTAQILGCTWEELKSHIEGQFWPGMSWENIGEWHVDHRIPVSSAATEEEVLKLNHYTNLQPLWADDNFKKNDRLDWTPAESEHASHENDY